MILLDDNKAVVKDNEIDLSVVAEKLHSPYLIMIPHNSTTVLMSQSNLYPYLAMIKDLSAIQDKRHFKSFTKRLTHIPPIINLANSERLNLAKNFI